MRFLVVLLLVTIANTVGSPARAGHEMPIYPSYYPQEIRIEPMTPLAAAEALTHNRIQAYVGAAPEFASDPGEPIAVVESLGSYLVVRVNPESPRVRAGHAVCDVARSVISTLVAEERDFRFHPYPINPFHADYLHHFDLAAKVKDRYARKPPTSAASLAVRSDGPLAERIKRRYWPQAAAEWDVRLEQVTLGNLLVGHWFGINGWFGPPWLKDGWFHAYRLLAESLPSAAAKARAQALVERLQLNDVTDGTERINTERDLVSLLTRGCDLMVVGYGLRREYYNGGFTDGIENIAFDSQAGFNSAIFLRTVKLKDFPWNGWLSIGIGDPPQAAWNPVAGFTDPIGALIWRAIGDPALFPEPYDEGWTMNRIGRATMIGGK